MAEPTNSAATESQTSTPAASSSSPSSSPRPSKHYGFPLEAFDPSRLPDFDTTFLSATDAAAFINALAAPDPVQSPTEEMPGGAPRSPTLSHSSSFYTKRFSSVLDEDNPQAVAAHAAAAGADVTAPDAMSPTSGGSHRSSMFITAQNDWAPVNARVPGSSSSSRRKGGRRRKVAAAARAGRRTKDETREGYLYGVLKYPFLATVVLWVLGLSAAYVLTRLYIAMYEQLVTWRGRREKLRRQMRQAADYDEWVAAARNLDAFLGNKEWKEENEFAYYDSKTVRRVETSLRRSLRAAEAAERAVDEGRELPPGDRVATAVEDLRALVEACVKNNFVGTENPRLYGQTYYGTKNLVQNFVDEGTF